MSVPASAPRSLSAAAADFERELARYEKLAAELRRTKVHSQKTLSRTQKLLGEATECEEALGDRLRSLLEAMNGARDAQQACMEQTLTSAHELQRRATAFTTLLERVAALGTKARESSEPAIEAITRSSQGERGPQLMSSLEALGDRMVAVIAEADHIAQDAESDDWPEIARDVKSLKQQMQAAHGRVVQACTAVGEQLLS
ncbi:MAG: hypothetical protein ABW252_12890 [Polyangiales bacterium]